MEAITRPLLYLASFSCLEFHQTPALLLRVLHEAATEKVHRFLEICDEPWSLFVGGRQRGRAEQRHRGIDVAGVSATRT